MRHFEVTRCKVADGAMTQFVNAVQQWERAALAHENAPLHHAVLVDPEEPSEVLIITEFADREASEAFAASGLLGKFMDGVMQCSVGSAERGHYDLFYAAGQGERAIFGELPRDRV